MIVKNVPWRYLMDKTVYIEDRKLAELYFGDCEEECSWVLMKSYVDPEHGIQFLVIACGEFSPFILRRKQIRWTSPVRFQRAADLRIVFPEDGLFSDEEHEMLAEADAVLHKKYGPDQMRAELREYTEIDLFRTQWHPDVLRIPYETVRGREVNVFTKRIDGNTVIGELHNGMCDREMIILLYVKSNGEQGAYAVTKK